MATEATEESSLISDDIWSLRSSGRQKAKAKKARQDNRRLLVLLLVLALVLAGAYFARERILHSARPSPPVPPLPSAPAKPAASGASAMLTAVRHSLGEKTASIELTATAEVGAKKVRVAGSGEVDFATHQAKLSLSYPDQNILGGKSIRVIATGGRSYVSVPGLSKYMAGKKWISVAEPQGVAPGSSNPTAFLSALEAHGAVVRVVSPRRVTGVMAEGYHVTFPPEALAAVVQSEPAVARALAGIKSLEMTVYCARSTGLLLEADSTFTETVAGQLISGQSDLVLSHYGLKTDFSAPPPALVTTMKAFLKKAAGSAHG